jgi:ribosomal protein S17
MPDSIILVKKSSRFNRLNEQYQKYVERYDRYKAGEETLRREELYSVIVHMFAYQAMLRLAGNQRDGRIYKDKVKKAVTVEIAQNGASGKIMPPIRLSENRRDANNPEFEGDDAEQLVETAWINAQNDMKPSTG